MKFAIIVLFADLIGKNYSKMGTLRYGIIPFLVVMVPVVVILVFFQRHLSDTIIIVAIGVVSKNGEALILDNIGFYGDVEKSEANAINAAVAGADENTIRITDNSVMAENGARIIVNDASGRLVADGEGSAHIAALQNGFYMATVKTAKGTRTVKFIKR